MEVVIRLVGASELLKNRVTTPRVWSESMRGILQGRRVGGSPHLSRLELACPAMRFRVSS